MKHIITLALLLSSFVIRHSSFAATLDLPADELADRIRGGVVGQMLGNLNGLPHEFKFIAEPGAVSGYVPALPDGARTDDDTDVEWVYLGEIARGGEVLLPPAKVRALWQRHINDWIWSAADSARQLMDLGLEPPLTGRTPLNTWADYNIAGQFVTDMMALGAPAMPRTAAQIGAHYAAAVVDGEPLQAAQLFSAMLALAWTERDMARLVETARPAADPRSEVHRITGECLDLWRQHPADWREPRRVIRDRYTRFGGVRPDMNGYALNTAATLLALLYGGGDFVKTLECAFNLGWDADNTAAFVGTLLGMQRGWKWMQAQGWKIKDVYRNDRRDDLPLDETITGYGDKVIALAHRVIAEHGGEVIERDGGKVFRIRIEEVANVAPFVPPAERKAELQKSLRAGIARDLAAKDKLGLARAVYLATALDLAPEFMRSHEKQWAWGVSRLERLAPNVIVTVITATELPHGRHLREAFQKAGVLVPKQ